MKRLILILVAICFTANFAFGSENFNYKTKSFQENLRLADNNGQKLNKTGIKAGVLVVPAGETFKCVFMAPVSTETAYTGQEVVLALANDFYYNNILIAPAGSTVSGTVIESSKARHGSVSGKLTMRFTHILTPSGYDVPISALVKTEDNSGVLIGGKFTGYANKEIPLNMETSAYSFVPPYLGVRAGTAAAMTTAVETGGGGLLKSIWDKGVDVEISVNTRVELILTQPITITPSEF